VSLKTPLSPASLARGTPYARPFFAISAMKTPDHEELWRDALNDAAPDAFAQATLASTLAHARRVRRTRHSIRITAGASVAVVAALFGLLLSRSPHTMVPSDRSPAVIAHTSEPNGIRVRYLTDEELLARFPDQPVGLVGSGSSREFMVLATARSD
jgi:hypothetical protein